MKTLSILLLSVALTALPQQLRTGIFGIPDPPAAPGNAHRMIAWASYEALVDMTDAQMDMWKSRGVDGFVIQTRYLDDVGGVEQWTDDPNDPLNVTIVEGADVHLRQRTLRDNHFAERCHARGMAAYLGFYLSNYQNLSTPLMVWNDDAGWAKLLPLVRGVAGAAKLLHMDGIATDSENYRSDSQTWNWDYPGVTQDETTVRALARQRGHAFMDAVLAGFPHVAIINYRIEIPGDWEEKVQQQVNHVTGIWDKSVFPDFWGGIADAGGFAEIHFFDPIFYKSWQIGSGWDEALAYNVAGVQKTLSQRWANWAYAAPRLFLSPFAWIDPGPSDGSFDDARPPDYVAAQLNAFHRWGEGNMFGLYTQHINDFDYTPYVPAMQAASTPDGIAPPSLSFTTAQRQPEGDAASARPIASMGPRQATPATPLSPASAALRVEQVASGVLDPTDMAFVPDGRLLVAERSGRIRIIRDGTLVPGAALVLDDMSSDGGNGLLAIAIDPHFDRTPFVYVIYTAVSAAGTPAFRLARFRAVNDTLGDRAVLLDRIPAAVSQASASLRFGPDGKLYAAFDAGGDASRIGNLGSYNGKILRLNPDGSTPADRAGAGPIFAYGYSAAAGLDWHPGDGTLWVAGTNWAHVGQLRSLLPLDRSSVIRTERPENLVAPPAVPTGIAVYRGDRIPWLDGDLLVSGANGPDVTRIHIDAGTPPRVLLTEPVLTGAVNTVRALTVGIDGAIYFCAGADVMRLVPAR